MKKTFTILFLLLLFGFYTSAQTICDDFNYANNTVVTGWTEQSGDWQVNNNQLMSSGNTSWEYITMDGSTQADGCITMRAIYGSTTQTKFIGPVARYVSPTSNILVKIQDNSSSGAFDKCFFYVDDNLIHSFDGTFGTDLILQMEYIGDTVWARVDVDRNGTWDYVDSTAVSNTQSGLCGVGSYASVSGDDYCYGPCCNIPEAASSITGTSTVCQGQDSVSYSVPTIAFADSCVWEYTGTGATITGNTENIKISFSASATSGDLTVYGQSTCGSGTVSPTFAITVNDCTGIDEIGNQNDVKIIPNPSNGIFTIQFTETPMEEMLLQISNASGQIVYMQNATGIDSEQLEVDVQHLPAGIYSITLTSSENTITKSIILEK